MTALTFFIVLSLNDIISFLLAIKLPRPVKKIGVSFAQITPKVRGFAQIQNSSIFLPKQDLHYILHCHFSNCKVVFK